MPHQLSSAVRFKMDNASAALTDISGSINNITVNGGNGLVEDTGMGDSVRTQIRDIGIINTIDITGMVNSTTYTIFAPLVNGTSLAKTVEVRLVSGQYLSGESDVGAVSFSVPIGLQTFTAQFASNSNTGFDATSVALA